MQLSYSALDKYCPLCGKRMEAVLSAQEGVVNGWVCWSCWPVDGSWLKALGRERVLK